jgi:hypothetical protein
MGFYIDMNMIFLKIYISNPIFFPVLPRVIYCLIEITIVLSSMQVQNWDFNFLLSVKNCQNNPLLAVSFKVNGLNSSNFFLSHVYTIHKQKWQCYFQNMPEI